MYIIKIGYSSKINIINGVKHIRPYLQIFSSVLRKEPGMFSGTSILTVKLQGFNSPLT